MIIFEDPLNPPVIILIEPQEGGNIGSTARAMMNFGLKELRLVRPRPNWLQLFTRQMASGANEILDSVRVFETTAEAVADIEVLYATASKTRDMVKPVFTPRIAAEKMSVHAAENVRLGILFGTESSGLENEDVMRASALISIPTSGAFDSLNLAQAVLLMGYEWMQGHLSSTFSPVSTSGKGQAIAPLSELEGFFDQLEEELDKSNFWRTPEKKPDMFLNVRNIFNRSALTTQEVRTLRGIIKALVYHRWGIYETKRNKPSL